MKIDFDNCFCPYAHHPSFRIQPEHQSLKNFWRFWISDSIKKKLGFDIFRIGKERCHQLIEEVLGILDSRLHIVKLGFQSNIFGEERADV